MKVSELISLLEKQDQDLEVMIYSRYEEAGDWVKSVWVETDDNRKSCGLDHPFEFSDIEKAVCIGTK